MKAEKLIYGGKYNWCHDKETRLVYVGKEGPWYQFEKVSEPGVVWCEVLSLSLEFIEETKN